jgi:uncharacterized membrane protein YphA (DoxX/SURF4 family)
LIVALVALRLATGWHFFKEGADHLQDDDFSSATVLWSAKGPLAPMFQQYIADPRGYSRLNYDYTKGLWKDYVSRAVGQYGFDENQSNQAQAALQSRLEQLSWYLSDNQKDIDQFWLEWQRLDQASADQGLSSVEFRRSWMQDKETELRTTARPWFTQIKSIRNSLADDLYRIHARDNASARRKIVFPDPGHSPIDSIITWLTFLVGVCLILGLFTRVASIAGALFLLSVILTQPPWIPDAADTYYQMVEMLALVVLAAAAAGRYAGLDFIIHSFWLRLRNRGNTAQAQGA